MRLRCGNVLAGLFAGFLIGLAATHALGFVVLAFLDTLHPRWEVAWVMAGTGIRLVWVGVPLVALYAAMALLFWRRHRTVALGVVLYAVTDLVFAAFA